MSTLTGRFTPLGQTYAQLAAAQKSSVGVSLYSRWVNRPLGRVFAVVAFRFGLTPNQVTIVSASMTFAGVTLLALAAPSWPAAIGVALLLVLGYALDSADGQVARLRGGGSPAGEWVDHVIDAAKVIALPGAVLIHWYRFVDLPTATLLVPLAAMVLGGTWFFAEILTQMLERLHPAPSVGERRRPAWQPVLALLDDYGVRAWSFALLALPAVFVMVFVALTALTALMIVRQLYSWYRRVSALQPSASRSRAATTPV